MRAQVKRCNTDVDLLDVQEKKVKVLTGINLRAAMSKLVPKIGYGKRDSVKELCTKIVEAMRIRQVSAMKKRKLESENTEGGGGGGVGGGNGANNGGGGGGGGAVSGDGVGGGDEGSLKSSPEKTRKLDPPPTSQPPDPEVRRVDTSVRMSCTCFAFHFNQTVRKSCDLSPHFTIHAFTILSF